MLNSTLDYLEDLLSNRPSTLPKQYTQKSNGKDS